MVAQSLYVGGCLPCTQNYCESFEKGAGQARRGRRTWLNKERSTKKCFSICDAGRRSLRGQGLHNTYSQTRMQ